VRREIGVAIKRSTLPAVRAIRVAQLTALLSNPYAVLQEQFQNGDAFRSRSPEGINIPMELLTWLRSTIVGSRRHRYLLISKSKCSIHAAVVDAVKIWAFCACIYDTATKPDC
jgi:hypothetical protein